MSDVRTDWTRDEIAALFDLPFGELVFRAQTVHREHHAPDQVQMSTLLSIKTGGCPEDCGYCNQSVHAETGLKATKLMDVRAVLQAAAQAKDNGSSRFCMGAAWRNPKDRDMPAIVEIVKGVGAMGLETCMTLGMLKEHQAERLAEAGLDYYNHIGDVTVLPRLQIAQGLGKKWTARYRVRGKDGKEWSTEYDFKVVAKEKIVLPAGELGSFEYELLHYAGGDSTPTGRAMGSFTTQEVEAGHFETQAVAVEPVSVQIQGSMQTGLFKMVWSAPASRVIQPWSMPMLIAGAVTVPLRWVRCSSAMASIRVESKAQAASMLGIQLSDQDVLNVPLLAITLLVTGMAVVGERVNIPDELIPADARVIDGSGLSVYPGFIDAFGSLGIPAPPTGAGAAAAGDARRCAGPRCQRTPPIWIWDATRLCDRNHCRRRTRARRADHPRRPAPRIHGADLRRAGRGLDRRADPAQGIPAAAARALHEARHPADLRRSHHGLRPSRRAGSQPRRPARRRAPPRGHARGCRRGSW